MRNVKSQSSNPRIIEKSNFDKYLYTLCFSGLFSFKNNRLIGFTESLYCRSGRVYETRHDRTVTLRLSGFASLCPTYDNIKSLTDVIKCVRNMEN